MAEIVYWAPLVGFVGMCVLAFRIEHEMIKLMYLRRDLAEISAKVLEESKFVAESNAIVTEAVALNDYGAKEEAMAMLRSLAEVRR